MASVNCFNLAAGMRKIYLLLMVFACFFILMASAEEQVPQSLLVFYYYDRPPFHFINPNGRPDGFIVKMTDNILAEANISHVWKLVPAYRVLNIIKNDEGLNCSTGWYKTKEREEYANFTLPIYRNKPLVAIARINFPVAENITAKQLFSIPGVHILIKKGFTIGDYMNKLLEKVPISQIQSVTTEQVGLVKMIQAGRSDFSILTTEEVEAFREQPEMLKNIKILTLPDVPSGDERFIICNKKVDMSFMVKINAAIEKLKLNKAK
ncbi:ABC transporter substrate-binding protein [Chromobacterium sp. ASV23]|uniref:substrate-binding periplasmic protein n=1 Tax=Chromobacterium sp. ASV23 TaxID=2795110 RepID=UPI0018ED457D|nr:transporter substrate-binding domain-containing protein [Chromobacterium sp. ASV23]